MVVNYIDQLFLGLLFSAGALICYLITKSTQHLIYLMTEHNLLIAAKIMLHICERSQEGLRLMTGGCKHHQGSDCLKLGSIL